MLATSLSEDTDDIEESESAYEEDGLLYTFEWRRYIHLTKRIEELECTAWYDPGMLLLYRKYSMEVTNLQYRLIEMNAEYSHALSTRQLNSFKNPGDFLLNLIDVKSSKEDISTRALGRDDILARLDSLERYGHKHRPYTPVEEKMEEYSYQKHTPILEGDGSSSVEDLSRNISDHCKIASYSSDRRNSELRPSIDGQSLVSGGVQTTVELQPSGEGLYSESLRSGDEPGEFLPSSEEIEGRSTTYEGVRKTRKRWYRVSDREEEEVLEEELQSEEEEAFNPEVHLAGRPNDENILVSHRVFLPPRMLGDGDECMEGALTKSMAYVVIERTTKELPKLLKPKENPLP